MSKKIIPIKYTSRDFESIKRDLIEHAKRYYEDTYKDFNEGSFASLMLDTVAYIGDILSFYLDYQANESYLNTAIEYNNVLKIARQMGYKFTSGRSSAGIASFYIEVPSLTDTISPDMKYAPVLQKNSTFSTNNGTKFILNEDVRFDMPTNQVVPLKIGTNGKPLSYGIKATGHVISGIIVTDNIEIGEYERFKKIKLSSPNIIEILSVYDSEGNEYFEVDNLSQNIIYKSITNADALSATLSKEILKPYIVPRRFTVENELDGTYIQFGASSDVTLEDDKRMLADPATAVLQMNGKGYISSDTFDPTRLQNSDKFGISPSNTTLKITYRYNPTGNLLNYAANSLTNVDNAIFMFNKEQDLNFRTRSSVETSLEITNEGNILGEARAFNSDELKVRVKNIFAAQSRAVTLQDYKALSYGMPSKFGAIKRVNVIRDEKSSKRNLNLYILCEDGDGYLCKSNEIVRQNLKTWLLQNKMINDTINILDGKVVNYGIEFIAVGVPNKSKHDILVAAVNQLKTDFSKIREFGEPFYLTDIWASLKKVESILDVVDVKLVTKSGGKYSEYDFNIEERTSADKRFVEIPLNVVLELKYPDSDIKGSII